MLWFLLIAFIWSLLLLVYDAYWTNKGIKAGIGVESNELVTILSGTSRPTFLQILGWETLSSRFPLYVVGLVTYEVGISYIIFLCTLALLVAGIKNIQGAREWQWMFSHPGKPLPVMETIWQKIVGFWG